MKILENKKILWAILLAAMSYSATAKPSCEPYSRIINAAHDRPASVPLNPIDQSPASGNHFQLKALGLYSDKQIQQLDTESIEVFKKKLGLDFGTGTFPIPLGNGLVGKALFLPGSPLVAVMIPYLNGQKDDIIVINDTKGKEGKVHIESGNMVLFVSTAADGSGSAILPPGSAHAGARVENQDNYFYGNIDLAKRKSNGTLSRIENFSAISDQIGRSPLNEWGTREFFVTLNLIDEDGEIGYGHSMTVTSKYDPDDVTLKPTVMLRNTYIFPKNCL